ncbi:MAG: PD40 domain-containing protein, partial [Flavobacteriales bacterium]|nr:PD40 domain-containing protein [Flavobacteriales bacterium]
MIERRSGMRGVILLLTLMLASLARAQEEDPGPCDPPTDKKLVKLLEAADKAKDPAERHRTLKETLETGVDCGECLFRLGMSAFRIAQSSNATFKASLDYFDRLEKLCPDFHADVPYHQGTMHYANGSYKEAALAFKRFLDFPTEDKRILPRDMEKKVSDVEEVMPELRFYLDFYRSDAVFEPKLVAGVSTQADEYLPMLSPDNELLFFTRLSKVKPKGSFVSVDVEELTESRGGAQAGYGKGRALPEPFNTGDSYGGVTISVNNKEMFVTICGKPDPKGYRNCDLYRTHYDSHMDFGTGQETWEWTEAQLLSEAVNGPDSWESQPTLSADGRTMYFATVRPDSKGTDIYFSTRGDDGIWSAAQPLPGPVNTSGDEKAPFLHSDSRTLYFAARPPVDENGEPDLERGHRGAGGYDIFFSRMQEDGTWGEPRNVGHPINTDQDEHGLIVSADSRTAMFASGRYKGAGGLDIYSFGLPKDVRPEDVLIVKGDVRDERGEV